MNLQFADFFAKWPEAQAIEPPLPAYKPLGGPLGARRLQVREFLAQACDAKPLTTGATLKPVRPNVGIEVAYCKALLTMIDEMNRSIVYWLSAAYRHEPPRIAQDELSSAAMRKAVQELAKRWTRRFNDMSERVGKYFAQSVQDRTDGALKQMFADAGWTIDWKMTPGQKDVLGAVINENVSLIKSIPAEHLQKVEGLVMRSVAAGYDMQMLRDGLRKQFGVTCRRAEFIARDQTSKTTSMLHRARQVEAGIDDAIWVHSHAGREPRPNHVRFGKEQAHFDPKQGMWDPDADGKGRGRYIQPGELIGCRCTCRSVIPGLKTRGSNLTVVKRVGMQRVTADAFRT